MDIFLFDMDSVLLKPEGYHHALRETVHEAARSLGFEDIQLSQAQINQFEALGISSEWHSSALCVSVLLISKDDLQMSPQSYEEGDPGSITATKTTLNLDELFKELSVHPLKIPARQRAMESVKTLAENYGADPTSALEVIRESESIDRSSTMNIFQELILGSDVYEKTYSRKAKIHCDSYLQLYDAPLLSQQNTVRLLEWVGDPGCGAAIMTNRPSNTLLGTDGTPEAEMGAQLVGLAELPMIGYGELSWLAERVGGEAGQYSKPSWQHAMAAILSAAGRSVEESLRIVGKACSEWKSKDLVHLKGASIIVFEDTPGGLVSVHKAGELLRSRQIQVSQRMIGITDDGNKRVTLEANGATVYPSINQALDAVEHF